MKLEMLTRLLALAARLEGEGQLNNAKLFYAAVDSLLTSAAYQLDLPGDKASLLAESDQAMDWLEMLDFEPEFLGALDQARAALAEERLPHFSETPDPFVCRNCGHLSMQASQVCPVCGSQPVTFKRFWPVFWLNALDPFSALDLLRSTPEQVAALLEGVTDSQANQSPETGGWSLKQAIAHLRDAQGVLAFRVNLLIDHENPVLESKAVFEWAEGAAGRPETVSEIYKTYRSSRAGTVARLEGLPLAAWWRRGQHEEFGELRLFQQVSYFACHELIHIPQIEQLITQ